MTTSTKFELDFEKMREYIDLEQLNADLIGYRDQIARLRVAVEALAAERDALKDAARLALDALNTCETEGEQVRYSTYDTESVGSAIAALKAVL